MSVGEDKARRFGGAGSYFASKLPAVLKETGSATEQTILYNNLRAAAIAASTNAKLTGATDHKVSAGGSANSNYSIIAVKWAPGQVNALYDPAGFGNGMLFDMEALNGGNLMKIDGAGGNQINGYAMRMKSYFGMLTANPRNVATIVNIDIANTDTPTEDEIDGILDAIRAQTGGSTMLLMHPKVKTFLNGFKATNLQTVVETRDYNRTFDAWNGIPIITSYNFLNGTEVDVA